jgi:hypothetical protein
MIIRDRIIQLQPFIQIVEFESSILEREIKIKIPREIASTSRKSIYIRDLYANDILGNLDDAYSNVKEIRDNAAIYLQNIENCLKALNRGQTDIAIIDHLAKCCDGIFISFYITKLILANKLKAELTINKMEEMVKVAIIESTHRKGCAIIDFPGQNKKFGYNFNEIYYKKLVQPFLDIISYLDKKALITCLGSLQNHLKEDLNRANAIFRDVGDIVSKYSRLGTIVFIANVSNYPLIILKEGILFIKEERKADYPVDCYLIQIEIDKKGNKIRDDTDKPLVVAGGETGIFEFLTSKKYVDMERKGDEIKLAYDEESEAVKAKMQFTIKRPGLFGTVEKTLITPLAIFGKPSIKKL